jgi:CHRD domain
MKKHLVCLVLALACCTIPATASAQERVVCAFMFGFNEVPPVDTDGFGVAVLWIQDDGLIRYFISWENLRSDAFIMHIHFGGPGMNGPIILDFLNPGALEGLIALEQSGAAHGTFSSAHFEPAPGLPTYAMAIQAILDGRCYANVHSRMFPGGEIRGQTEEIPPFEP